MCSLYASVWVGKSQLGVFQITLLFASNGRAEQVVSTLRKHVLASGLLNLSSESFQRTMSLAASNGFTDHTLNDTHASTLVDESQLGVFPDDHVSSTSNGHTDQIVHTLKDTYAITLVDQSQLKVFPYNHAHHLK